MEYQGATEEEGEEVTLEEQAAWWLALKLRPGCMLAVSTVLPSSSPLRLTFFVTASQKWRQAILHLCMCLLYLCKIARCISFHMCSATAAFPVA